MDFRLPFEKDWPITQKYGDKLTSSFHTGIDYGVPEGTRILASGDGIVRFADMDQTGYGKCVIIQHDEEHSTLYAHLSMILVYVGEEVRQGQCIGLSGNTGYSTGPHLHFEARRHWNEYRTHFDPNVLLQNAVPSKSEPEKLLTAEELETGHVILTAPLGAWAHDRDFREKLVFVPGTTFQFTGEIMEHDGLQFCRCIPDCCWIAVNDGETQILENI